MDKVLARRVLNQLCYRSNGWFKAAMLHRDGTVGKKGVESRLTLHLLSTITCGCDMVDTLLREGMDLSKKKEWKIRKKGK